MIQLPAHLCYNCFQEREAPEGPCPHCGFDLAENEKNSLLPCGPGLC